MKKARLILAASLLTIGGFATVTMSSCSSDDKVCNTGYEGDDCKTLSRAKFIGQWQGDEVCTVGTDNYTITITASSESEIKIVYSNVYNDPSNYTAVGTMTGPNGYSFSGTAANGVTFSGTGTYDSGTGRMIVNYKVETAGVLTNTCTFTGTKL